MNDDISKGMVTYASKIPKESIIEIKGKVLKTEKDIVWCSQRKVELQVLEIGTLNKSASMLPF